MKKVLITGGNKGIGLEVTRQLLALGYHVIVTARDFKDFEFKDSKDVTLIPYDLNDVAGIKKLVKRIGTVDVLINNAGIMNSLPYDDYQEEAKQRLMNVNLYAPIALITYVSELMMKNHGGRIVSVASVAGQIGHPDIWYGVSKAGIINATKSFARQFGEHGILINAVAPGPVKTDMLQVIPEARKDTMKQSTYLKRFANPEEIAETIVWLATKSPEYINGVCIDLNNGAFPR